MRVCVGGGGGGEYGMPFFSQNGPVDLDDVYGYRSLQHPLLRPLVPALSACPVNAALTLRSRYDNNLMIMKTKRRQYFTQREPIT